MYRVNQLLHEARSQHGYSLSFVAKQTRMSVEHLEIMENGVWNKLASYPYALGMVSAYAKFLGLEAKKINAIFRREIEAQQVQFIRSTDYDERKEKTTVFSKNVFLFVFLFLIVVFFLLQLLVFLQKPLLKIQPTPARLSMSKPLIVRGVTQPGALLYLNNQRLYQNDEGEFSQELYLKQGKRTITIRATGQNGRTETQTIEVNVY